MADWTFTAIPAGEPALSFLCKDVCDDYHILVECSSIEGADATEQQLEARRVREDGGFSFEVLSPMAAMYLADFERLSYSGKVDGYDFPNASVYRLWN